MADEKEIIYRLSKVAKELNVGTTTLVEYLNQQGHKDISDNPNSKLNEEQYQILLKKFGKDKIVKEKANTLKEQHKEQKERIQKTLKEEQELPKIEIEKPSINIKVLGKIDLEQGKGKDKKTKKNTKNIQTPSLFDTPESIEKNISIETPETPQEQIIDTPPINPIKNEENQEAAVEEEILVFDKPSKNENPVPETSELEKSKEAETPAPQNEAEEHVIRAKDKVPKLTGPVILGKIDLEANKPKEPTKDKDKKKNKETDKKNQKPDAPKLPTEVKDTTLETSTPTDKEGKKKKRKRNRKPANAQAANNQNNNNANKDTLNLKEKNKFFKPKEAPDAKKVDEQVKKTLSGMNQGAKRIRQKLRKDKKEKQAQKLEMQQQEMLERANVLEVTEFLTANELASLMNVPVNEVIAKCMQLGLFVSINQRIDADVIALIAEEFGFKVEFISAEEKLDIEEEADNEEDLVERSPIVTVMGHVDHGKTSLLDYIRKSNVIAGEAGGITQHIGAYEVTLDNGKKITFLDTPGHEAFTAMRARGAQITDIAIIVIAADDQVMPQTIEAINHAQAANVPMIFAINKIDKPGADPTKIRQQLAEMNLLVEDWGGPYQCQEISAKNGINIDLLLEKILIEAELLELKANPNRKAKGTVIEARLDKGRGVVSTVLVQNGTLKIGDIILANCHYGRVKAMFDERQKPVKKAGPSTPVQILGLNGVPQAGDKFNVLETEREAREIASKRQQLLREQAIRTQKHITLDEIARRRAVGNFKELNLIVKGDVDGSVEALSDALLKLSTEEVAVRIIHKAVGQISESDVLLASSSDAIIIGFQVRPSNSARKLAEQEQIDIRLYSIIYDAINEVKDAIEGMLAPTIEEKIVGTAEVKEVFKISKVGMVAGCQVTEGKISRNLPIRVIRDGIVIHTGKIESLKRFKDDVKEVLAPMDCGIMIQSYSDIQIGDVIESYEQIEIKRKLNN
ncbi:MAG: translation initiation factor IF-2 [Bacteroidia bacterium]|nr:MAG: translation initiation factor IF-2 [Bacteroidia bacterium]